MPTETNPLIEDMKEAAMRICATLPGDKWPIAVSFNLAGYNAIRNKDRDRYSIDYDLTKRIFPWPVHVWPRQIEPVIYHYSQESFAEAAGRYSIEGAV